MSNDPYEQFPQNRPMRHPGTPAAPERGAADLRSDFERKIAEMAEMADAAGEQWFDDKYDLTPAQLFEYVEKLKQKLEAKESENKALRSLAHRAAMLIASEGSRYVGLIADLKAAAKGEALGKGG